MTRAEARLVRDDFSQDCWGSRQPPAKSHGAVAPARPRDAVLWLEMESPTSHNMESRLHTPTRHQTLEKIAYSFLYSRHHPAKTHRLCFYREAFAVLHSLPGNSLGEKKKKCWHLLSPPKISLRLLKIYQLLTEDDTRAGRQITSVEKQRVQWTRFQFFTQSMTPSVLYITGQWIIPLLPLKRPISIPSQSWNASCHCSVYELGLSSVRFI